MNKVIITLIASNFFVEAAFGFIAPIFSVFIVEDVTGGTLSVAGIAAGVYWFTKSVVQIFVGRGLDKAGEEKYRMMALVLGNLIMGGAAFLYLLVEAPIHIYAVQFVLALGGALSVPAWYTMFSRHIDEMKEAFEWSFSSSVIYGLGVGGSGVVGGLIADSFGFDVLFILAGTAGLLGALLLVPLYKHLSSRELAG